MVNVKVEITEKGVLGREISFEVDKEKVEKEKKEIISEIRKNVEIEGFRKGKAPEDIIEKKFGELIKENLFKRIIPEVYIETVKEHNLKVVAEPDVFDVSLDDVSLKFKVYIEIKPEFELKRYKEIPVKRITPEKVTEKEVEDVLTEWEKKPSFASAVIDPAKRNAWKEKIREQLEVYKKMDAIRDENKQIWNEIMKDIDFPVPEKMVREEAIRYTEEQLMYMNMEGKSEEEKKKMAQEIFEKVKPEAVSSIKRYFILDKVAEMENIVVDEKEIDERIAEISRSSGESPQQIRQKIEKAGKMYDLKDEIRINKAFRFIRENAKFIEKIILPGEDKKLEIIR